MSDSQYAVIYDLHSHTTASDGRLAPRELVHRAHEIRVGILAITNHDNVAAIPAAREEIARTGLPLTLVNGVGISTPWENHKVHIVGPNIDIAHPTMTTSSEEQKARRRLRGQMIVERPEKTRILGAWKGTLRLTGDGAAIRDHFVRFLVEANHTKNTAETFKKYLARGKTGYTPPQWCTIKQAIDVIYHSGGKAVVTHPGRYGLSAKWLKRLLAHFSEQGSDATEVAQCQQAPYEHVQLAALAVQFGLLALQGSDFRQPYVWIGLGHKLWLPAGVEGVWHSWEAAAE